MDTAWFVDDVFTISHKWLSEFADEIVKRKITLRYECITRADRMNEEVIQLLKKVVVSGFGLVLKVVHKKL